MRDGVGVYCFRDGKYLVGVRNTGELGGPGGHIENGESPEEAAIREAREEFGITPKNLMLVGRGVQEPNGFRPFLYLCTEWDGEIKTDNVEMFCPAFRTADQIIGNNRVFKPFCDGVMIVDRWKSKYM